jgi:NNP family nitrate/nitrite transporter-like MFS transporter
MQFIVPIVITIGIFGVLGGAPQSAEGGAEIWMQNAGLILSANS